MNAKRIRLGAQFKENCCHFRVWAPKCSALDVVFETATGAGSSVPLTPEKDGYFSALLEDIPAGTLYRYRVNGDAALYPDPVSRFQPEGPHGPSQVIDPSRYTWRDKDWSGLSREGQVIYEMHIGTFTPEGTWAAAERELPRLAELGITVLEVMPVADFAGKFGWGYDGVNLFAPTRLYGTPDDFRHFVDTAHGLGLGVILDVVYNHFGPDGNYIRVFADDYFSTKYKNEWGDPINFDGPNSGPVREFYLANVSYWMDEFHIDGFRFDATQQIFDASPKHILAEMMERIRHAKPGKLTVAENECQETRILAPLEAGGHGFNVSWNDDFHHTALVALTGRDDAYYSDYHGSPQEFISAAKWGYLYQGQRYSWQKKRRGQPVLDVPPAGFATFLENHDQVANSARGLRVRLLSSPARYRAMTALWLLSRNTPMFFQGQEYGSTRPFLYFANHKPELDRLVHQGRRKFLEQFSNLANFALLEHVPDPAASETFLQCKLDPTEQERYPEIVALHRDLLRLRREDPAFDPRSPRRVDGAVLGDHAFVLRFFVEGGEDRLLVVNLGRDLKLREAPEPLLAPPVGKPWRVRWSSEDWRYGGIGHAPLESEDNWRVPGEAAVLLTPVEA